MYDGRDVNIMVCLLPGGTWDVRLVDLDWAGVVGKARYWNRTWAHCLLVGIRDKRCNHSQNWDPAHHLLHHTTVALGYSELSLPVCRSLHKT
jgi:hypothetical protein